MMSEWILYDVADGVCTITINRPEKKNAMGFAMLGDFIAAFSRAGEDDDAGVMGFTGLQKPKEFNLEEITDGHNDADSNRKENQRV